MNNGDVLGISERVIVSPSSGVFIPGSPGATVAAGEVIAHVEVAGCERVPVTSPFAGRLVEIVAWHGERVLAQQRVAWLRAS